MKKYEFSKRELQTVKLLMEGKSNKRIANELGISEGTVEYHLTSIYTKLHVSSRAEAILLLTQLGFSPDVSERMNLGITTGKKTGKRGETPDEHATENAYDGDKQISPKNGDEMIGKKTQFSSNSAFLVLIVIILGLIAVIAVNLYLSTPNNITADVAEAQAIAATLTAEGPMVVPTLTLTPILMTTATSAHMPTTVDYSTFLGGNGNTGIYDVAVCPDGSVVVAGGTDASDLPITPGVYDTTYVYTVPSDDNRREEGFVAKFDAAGALGFLTYLGGNSSDRIDAVAVDEQCSIYLTGFTESADFPTTANAYNRTLNDDGRDTFVTKLSSDGRTLLYSTFLGGTNWDYGNTITVDTGHNVYIGGFTHGSYPVTAGAADVSFGEPGDGFVAKLNADGSQLVYATYLGRDGEWDSISSIAVDNFGAVYVPFTNQGNTGGVTKISPDGRRFDYITPLPGNSIGLAVDNQRNAYVVGHVGPDTGTNFLVTANAFQSTYGGGWLDITIAKLDQNGKLIYGSYYGGIDADTPGTGNSNTSIAVDAAGNIYFSGITNSTNFPLAQPFQSTFGGNYDAFVVKFNITHGPMLSSYLGGSASENWTDGMNFHGGIIAVDNSGNIYVAGMTYSTDFPTTPNAFDNTFRGPDYDGFLTKISGR